MVQPNFDQRYLIVLLPELEICERGLTLDEAACWTASFATVSRGFCTPAIVEEQQMDQLRQMLI